MENLVGKKCKFVYDSNNINEELAVYNEKDVEVLNYSEYNGNKVYKVRMSDLSEYNVFEHELIIQ